MLTWRGVCRGIGDGAAPSAGAQTVVTQEDNEFQLQRIRELGEFLHAGYAEIADEATAPSTGAQTVVTRVYQEGGKARRLQNGLQGQLAHSTRCCRLSACSQERMLDLEISRRTTRSMDRQMRKRC
jgi:hypothetical protein